MAGKINRPNPFKTDDERLSTTRGTHQEQTGSNSRDKIRRGLWEGRGIYEKDPETGHWIKVGEYEGIQVEDKVIQIDQDIQTDLGKESIVKMKNNVPSSSSFKQDMKEALQEVFGIGAQIPIYMPHKLNRDSSRLTLGRKPPTKVWSKEELEFYNRKGIATNNLVNIKNKHLPNVFNPLLPSPLLTRESANIVIQKQDFNVSS